MTWKREHSNSPGTLLAFVEDCQRQLLGGTDEDIRFNLNKEQVVMDLATWILILFRI